MAIIAGKITNGDNKQKTIPIKTKSQDRKWGILRIL
jgi:hypothetical protein